MIFQHALIDSLKRNDERTAIECGDKVLSYASVLRISDAVTRFLLQLKVEKETIVGILLEDRSDLICCLIGVVNARCTMVLLDSSLPIERLAAIKHELNLKHVICSKDADSQERIERSSQINCYYFQDIINGKSEAEGTEVNYPTFDEDDSIYIYFTSGSTGRPKGIVGKNKSLLHFLEWEIAEFKIDSSYRFSQLVSPFFDAFLRDIFVPLLAGGTICIPRREDDLLSPEKFVSWIDVSRISLIHCVPSVFRLMNSDVLSAENYPDLKYVLLSGERINAHELKNWYRIFDSRIQLVNLYGTTETTMIKSFHLITASDVERGKIPIGKPIRDSELLVADKDLKPCSVLVQGDLYIVSSYATKGYLNDPQLTSERFTKISRGALGETIAYKTGDRARVLPDGSIDLLGREDRQVKLRGIRIELDEIENMLIQCELIKNAIVMKHTEESGQNEFLVAFVIADRENVDDTDLTTAATRYLTAHLPAYALPSKVVKVNEFPLLPNGKINYIELQAKISQAGAVIEPVNEVEAKLVEIWKQILGNKTISTRDKFNSIGGNSLSIMRLIGKIYKEFNVRMSLMELFNHLTVEQQAEFIGNSKRDNAFVLAKSEIKPAYYLSSAQERIYFAYKLDPTSTAYNIPMAWEITAAFDKVKIEKIVGLLIDRHESLRTEFISEKGKILQVIKPSSDFHLQEINVKNQSLNDTIAGLIKPFDLSSAPLIRCTIIVTEENKKILLVDIHHIVCDGTSQMNLYNDFLRLSRGEKLIPLPIQYKDYAEWEHRFKSTHEYNSNKEFWLKAFEHEVPKLQLPIVDLEITEKSSAGGNHRFEIDKRFIEAIQNDLKEQNVSTFSVIFSTFFLFLSQLTGQEDIVIGVNTSGRMQQEVEGVVGMFVKTLPVRYRMNSDEHFRNFVINMHNYLVQAISKQIFDLSDIVTVLNRKRANHLESLFQVMFVFQNFETAHLLHKDENFSKIEVENATSKYPITLFINEEEDKFNFKLEYLSAYFTPDDAEVLSTQFVHLIKKTSENINTAVNQITGSISAPVHFIESDIQFNF